MHTPIRLLVLAAVSLYAQDRPAYYVASVKPNATGPETGFSQNIAPDGSLTARNITVWNLIRLAYGLRDLQIQSAPDWVKSTGFDIQAKPPVPVPREESLRMLRALLEDRFRLRSHRETRPQAAYILTVADGGHKLPPASEGRNGTLRFGDITSDGLTLAGLCQILEFELDRPLVDQTGLTGPFAIRLQYASDRAAPGTADPSLPALSTALREQLGLKLESGRAPLEVFVIDAVEQPSEN